MERIFETFREASQEAAKISREHGLGASLQRRGESWAVIFDNPTNTTNPTNPTPSIAQTDSLAIEIDRLSTELKQARHDLASLSATNHSLRAQIAMTKQEHALTQPLLTRNVPSSFNRAVMDKMTTGNVEKIVRYEYLCVLSGLNEIDQAAFDEFKVASGLWIAIHNYEKIQAGPARDYVPERPRPNVEHCSSCGGVVSNGYCKCSS